MALERMSGSLRTRGGLFRVQEEALEDKREPQRTQGRPKRRKEGHRAEEKGP
jgi:hypothetical protein